MNGQEKRIRGRRRAALANQLADQCHTKRFTVTVAGLATSVGRKPTTVRQLLTEAGVRSRRLQIGFTDDEVTRTLVGRFRLGVPVQQLAVVTGIDERVIRQRLREAGVDLAKRVRRGDLTVPTTRLVELYALGWSLADLAVVSGCSSSMVRRVLLDAGVQLRPRGWRRRRDRCP